MLTVDPLVSAGLWLTLALAGAGLLAFYAIRRPQGVLRSRWIAIVGMMGLSFVLLLAILLNPTWSRPVPPPPGKPLLTILVDSSASMATPDLQMEAGGERTRYAAAVALARRMSASPAGAEMEVRVERFDERIAPLNEADGTAGGTGGATGEATDIAGAILASVEADRPQGQAIIVLTDGIQTASLGSGTKGLREAARFAKASGAPVFAVPLGGAGGGIDLAVGAHVPREIAFVGQKVALVADCTARGYTGVATVRLMAAGKEIAQEKATVSPEKPGSVRFEVMQEAPGLTLYELRVEPLDRELTNANNHALYLLRTVDKAARVMLVEGKPYWDSKFLMRHLVADPSIEVQSLVRVAPGRIIQRKVTRPTPNGGPATAPAIEEQWAVAKDAATVLGGTALEGCQVLILGRDTGEFLSAEALAGLQQWISRQGGTLVCYRGSPDTQVDGMLGRLLPVKWQPARESRYQLKLTDAGRGLNWFGGAGAEEMMTALPPLAVDTVVQQTRPLAVVLAKASGPQGEEEAPAISYQPYGSGRVIVIEGAGMWRWAFPPSSAGGGTSGSGVGGASGDEPYAQVWHAMLRWIISGAGLVPGEEAAVRPDKISFNAREPAAATVLTRPGKSAGTQPAATLSVEIRSSERGTGSDMGEAKTFPCEPSSDDPGAYRVQFGVLAPGRYEAVLKGAEPVQAVAVFDVRKAGEEELNLASRPDLLEMVARESGGEVVAAADAGQVVQRIHLNLTQRTQQRLAFTTAWDRWWIMLAVVALWGAAWGVRRASGLI